MSETGHFARPIVLEYWGLNPQCDLTGDKPGLRGNEKGTNN